MVPVAHAPEQQVRATHRPAAGSIGGSGHQLRHIGPGRGHAVDVPRTPAADVERDRQSRRGRPAADPSDEEGRQERERDEGHDRAGPRRVGERVSRDGSNAWSSTFPRRASPVVVAPEQSAPEPPAGGRPAHAAAQRSRARSSYPSRIRRTSCRPPFREGGEPCLGREVRSQLPHGPVEPGLDSAQRKAERIGRVLQRQADVEVQGDERPLIGRQELEAPLELVLVRQGGQRGRARRCRATSLDAPSGTGSAYVVLRDSTRSRGCGGSSPSKRSGSRSPRRSRQQAINASWVASFARSGSRRIKAGDGVKPVDPEGVRALRTPRDRPPSLVRPAPAFGTPRSVRRGSSHSEPKVPAKPIEFHLTLCHEIRRCGVDDAQAQFGADGRATRRAGAPPNELGSRPGPTVRVHEDL